MGKKAGLTTLNRVLLWLANIADDIEEGLSWKPDYRSNVVPKMRYDRKPVEATVAKLRPFMKNVNITFKVIAKGEAREVTSRRDGETHRVVDATAGDATGVVFLSLWDDNIEAIEVDKTYQLEKGYTSLFQRHLRLNIGRYGEINESEEAIEEVDTENDMSAAEHEQPRSRRRSYSRRGGRRDRGGRY